MTGAELETYVRRHINEQGITLSADRQSEIWQSLNLAREYIYLEACDYAPQAVSTEMEVERFSNDFFPFRDYPCFPLNYVQKILEVREGGFDGRRLTRSNQLGADRGDYDIYRNGIAPGVPWYIRLSKAWSSTDKIWVRYINSVEQQFTVPISSTSTEFTIGMPRAFHECIALHACILMLNKNEEDDARITRQLYNERMSTALNTLEGLDPLGEATRFANEFARAQQFNYGDI